MEIIMKGLGDIHPYEKNPRRNDDAVRYVAASITEFGFKVPIVIDSKGVIVAGHTRYKAAKMLEMDKVPCIIADDLTDKQIKAFRLADNKVSEQATWDFNMLNLEMDDLFDFDMGQFGFINNEDLVLDVDDDDFLQDTEITKEKKAKEITCPHCGEKFEA